MGPARAGRSGRPHPSRPEAARAVPAPSALNERRSVSKVFVGNLSFDTTREELEAFFAPVGEIAEVVVPMDRATGRPRGFAFVTFATAESAARAIETLNGAELGGRNLRVNEADAERPGRP